MERIGTKDAAEAILCELPSVVGAFVREDINGHPREIHILIAAGPTPRHFARDVRDLLEERLGVPIDQRVISIAQLAPSAADRTGGVPATGHDDGSAPATTAGAAARAELPAPTPRPSFEGAETERSDGRIAVHVTVRFGDELFTGSDAQIDSSNARLRAGARALLDAVNVYTGRRGRFELEDSGIVRALGRDYVLLTVLAHACQLGRQPLMLAGAHAVEGRAESAAALAALKAINRVLGVIPDRDGTAGS